MTMAAMPPASATQTTASKSFLFMETSHVEDQDPPHRSWWCEVTAFSLIYREYPANYGIRTTSPLHLTKPACSRDGQYISSK